MTDGGSGETPPLSPGGAGGDAHGVDSAIEELTGLGVEREEEEEDPEEELDMEDMEVVEFEEDDAPPEDEGDEDDEEDIGEDAAGGEDHYVKFAALPTTTFSTFRGHSDHVYCIDLSHDAKRAVSGGGDDTAYVWDVQTGAVMSKLSGHSDSIVACGFNHNSTLVATASMDSLVKIWNTENGQLLRNLEGPSSEIEFLAWHSQGNAILAGSEDQTCWVWSADNGAVVGVLAGHEAALTCGSFTPNGKRVLTGSLDGTVRLWDPATSSCVHTFKGNDFHRAGVVSLSCSSSAPLIASGGQDGTVRIASLESRRVVATLDHDSDKNFGDVRTREIVNDLSSVETVAFCPVAPFVASGATDSLLKVFDLNTGVVRQVCRHDDTITKVEFLPESTLMVSASADGTSRLWDSRSGDSLRLLAVHRAVINDFSLKNGIVATCGDDQVCHSASTQPL